MLVLIRLLYLLVIAGSASAKGSQNVTYDSKSLLINGRRELLFSGSIHYPRSTPEMWPDLITKAKHGGINVIQTYVFWNLHEPVEGQFNFEGRNDIVKFIKLVQEQGLYVTLRLGPFIEAEWNYGGFPYWLREVNNITFRTNNEPFKDYMKKYTKMVVKKMKEEKLYYPQGGPIIMSQIENEYNNVEQAYKEEGAKYVQWAGKMAVKMDTGVPWVMCKEKDAPDPVINSCNGRNCGDTFTGPNSPTKPFLWTENWTAQYRVFGDPPSQRAAEDLAFSVARFFSKNGTLVNYYMYHGGTNFGRTTSSFVTTRYYDEAPLDEYGLLREPKWGHLRDLHSALRLCKKALLWGSPSAQSLGKDQEARVYEKDGSNVCAAFLANNDTRVASTVTFRGTKYYLPPHSISILPDCKTVVYNTRTINAQHSARTFHVSKEANKDVQWEMYQEKIPIIDETSLKDNSPLEHYTNTKDTTDYFWYTTSVELNNEELPMRHDIHPVIQVASLGHAMHAFVNDEYVGSGHGTNIDKSFTFRKAITLKTGTNHISLLGMTVGYPDSGAYMERRLAGIHIVSIQGLNTGTLDLSNNGWGHQVGTLGEKFHIFKQDGSHRVQWTNAQGSKPLTWYKRYFDSPHGEAPVALDLSSMGKGQVWVNGQSIGRYWVSYLSPLGKPSQVEYHIPRSFLKPTDNLLVVFEETGGNPDKISVITVSRDVICTFISDFHPPHVKSWARKDSEIRAVVDDMKTTGHLKCPNHKIIQKITFANYGDPLGVCGNYTTGTCSAPDTMKIVQNACLGKSSCLIPISDLGSNVCRGVVKSLAVQAKCGRKMKSDE